MEELNKIWGINEDLTVLEIAARGIVMFFVALLLIRISGMRAFGKTTAFDNIITFLIGGVISRGVVGATPFLSAVAGGLVIVLVHRLLSIWAVYSKAAGKMVKGEGFLLYKDGNFFEKNLLRTGVTKHDIFEELRVRLHLTHLDRIEEIRLERTGKISFIKKLKFQKYPPDQHVSKNKKEEH